MSRPTKLCPYCAEEIFLEAIKCKHCGSMLNGTTPKEYLSGLNDVQGGVFGDKSLAIKADDVKGHIVQANGPVNFLAGETEEEKKQRLRERDYILARNWDKTTLLQKLDLAYRDLSNVDLSFSKLTDSNLSSAKFLYANLMGADMSGANMCKGDFSNANLSKARLSGSDLKEAKFTNCDLSYANLYNNNNLKGADFSNADLSHAILAGANIVYVNFSGATLKNTDFANSRITEVQTTGGAVSGLASDFAKYNHNTSKDKERAKRESQIIQFGALLLDIGLSLANTKTKANILSTKQASFKGARFDGTNFSGAYMQKIILESCYLVNVNFSKANLKYANLRNADLRGSNLNNADLTSADLSNADLRGANFNLGNAETYKSINLQNAKFDSQTQFYTWVSQEIKDKMRFW